MAQFGDFHTATDRDMLLGAAAGLLEIDTLPEPVTDRDKLIAEIAKDRKQIVQNVNAIGEDVDDLDERVSDLEDNPVSPEDVQAAVNNYMDDHPELTHLGFYRDSDGDLCESDE